MIGGHHRICSILFLLILPSKIRPKSPYILQITLICTCNTLLCQTPRYLQLDFVHIHRLQTLYSLLLARPTPRNHPVPRYTHLCAKTSGHLTTRSTTGRYMSSELFSKTTPLWTHPIVLASPHQITISHLRPNQLHHCCPWPTSQPTTKQSQPAAQCRALATFITPSPISHATTTISTQRTPHKYSISALSHSIDLHNLTSMPQQPNAPTSYNSIPAQRMLHNYSSSEER